MRIWFFDHPVIWGAIIVMSALGAALLQQPLLHGNGWGVFLTAATVGLPFAAVISILSILGSAERGAHIYMSEIWAFATLWLGMPLALTAGGIGVGLVNKMLPSVQNVGLNGLFFYAAALITSGSIWALVLTLWLKTRRYRGTYVFGRAFLTIVASGTLAWLLALATGHHMHTSVLILAVSVCEQIASGLYLLIAPRTHRSTSSSYA